MRCGAGCAIMPSRAHDPTDIHADPRANSVFAIACPVDSARCAQHARSAGSSQLMDGMIRWQQLLTGSAGSGSLSTRAALRRPLLGPHNTKKRDEADDAACLQARRQQKRRVESDMLD